MSPQPAEEDEEALDLMRTMFYKSTIARKIAMAEEELLFSTSQKVKKQLERKIEELEKELSRIPTHKPNCASYELSKKDFENFQNMFYKSIIENKIAMAEAELLSTSQEAKKELKLKIEELKNKLSRIERKIKQKNNKIKQKNKGKMRRIAPTLISS
jgi:hypothetical protein